VRSPPPHLVCLPCADSPERAEACRRALELPRDRAAELGRTAVEAAGQGFYSDDSGARVDWRAQVEAALAAKRSIRPEDPLPEPAPGAAHHTEVQVRNETTLVAARRLVEEGERPLALNFANGVHPGGGFLRGARAQEEVLCRSSALHATLAGDPMYAAHAARPLPDSSDWAILSPGVPVFRRDDGSRLAQPWTLGFLTAAAPYAPALGQPAAGDLLAARIRRVLAIAAASGYEVLVLGAWGCGAFGNDPERTARDFRRALEEERAGRLRRVVFAIADWSPARRFLGPFRDAFAAGA